ncbi:MAG: hypothetical protein U1E15_09585 [Hyphomicrobiales bacterium]
MTISAMELAQITEKTISSAAWLNFPQALLAPSPFDRSKAVEFRLDPTAAHNDFRLNFRQTSFELWALVLGQVPPVPGAQKQLDNIPHAKLLGIRHAHA